MEMNSHVLQLALPPTRSTTTPGMDESRSCSCCAGFSLWDCERLQQTRRVTLRCLSVVLGHPRSGSSFIISTTSLRSMDLCTVTEEVETAVLDFIRRVLNSRPYRGSPLGGAYLALVPPVSLNGDLPGSVARSLILIAETQSLSQMGVGKPRDPAPTDTSPVFWTPSIYYYYCVLYLPIALSEVLS
ncbi:hypothetical protein NMY22_g2850 [Coprinellus aureogranulatus]|nr:hypothetical protein NMY22_g2850 [Coprinellus aureogranulatus]